MNPVVTATNVWLGTGERHQWRGVKSRVPSYTETTVRIELSIENLPGDSRRAHQLTVAALQTLSGRQRISGYSLGDLGTAPKVICAVDEETIKAIRASRSIDNEFVVSLQEELRQLLSEASAR